MFKKENIKDPHVQTVKQLHCWYCFSSHKLIIYFLRNAETKLTRKAPNTGIHNKKIIEVKLAIHSLSSKVLHCDTTGKRLSVTCKFLISLIGKSIVWNMTVENEPKEAGGESNYSSMQPAGTWFNFSKEDTPALVSTVACFAAFTVYGMQCGALGGALPYLADEMDVSDGTMGAAFTSRGIGCLIGTLTSAYVMSYSDKYVSKDTITCIALCVCGIACAVVGNIYNFPLSIAFFGIQGYGFGWMDTFATCCFPEIWGKRVRPWMQALYTLFGIGAIIGPALVGACGLGASFNAFFLLSFVPLVGLLTYKSYYAIEHRNDPRPITLSITESNKKIKDEVSIEISTVDKNPLLQHQSFQNTNPNNKNNNSDTSSASGTSFSNTKPSTKEGKTGKIESFPDHPVVVAEDLHLPIDSAHSTHSTTHTPIVTDTIMERPPLNLRLTIMAFFFLYVGLIISFSGWIPTYALDADVTSSYSRAAYLTSIFYIALTVGRIGSTILSLYTSVSFMLRAELALLSISSILGMIILDLNYAATATVASLVAISLCAIYPIMLTIVDEFQYKV